MHRDHHLTVVADEADVVDLTCAAVQREGSCGDHTWPATTTGQASCPTASRPSRIKQPKGDFERLSRTATVKDPHQPDAMPIWESIDHATVYYAYRAAQTQIQAIQPGDRIVVQGHGVYAVWTVGDDHRGSRRDRRRSPGELDRRIGAHTP